MNRSKLTKARSWVPTNAVPFKFTDEHLPRIDTDVSGKDHTRASITSTGKQGFFSQLFSKPTTTTTNSNLSSAGPVFVNMSRKPRSPSAAAPDSIPPNLSIRSIPPDLLNDPAFSPDPLSHPLYVTNPDRPLDGLSPPQPISNADSHEELYMTESPMDDSQSSSPNGLGESHHLNSTPDLSNVSSSSVDLESSRAMGTASSSSMTERPRVLNSFSMPPPSSRSSSSSASVSSIPDDKPLKGLIVLEPPRVMSPPPSYDDSGHSFVSRPVAARFSSTPAIPTPRIEAVDVPPRPATTANDAPVSVPRRSNTGIKSPRRNKGLDPIDELDETNPLGLAIHHGGPYEAIKKLAQDSREPQTIPNSNRHRPQQASHEVAQKPSSRQPFLADSVPSIPYVPFGAPLNLTPGQVLPRNFQPYTQPPVTNLPSQHRQEVGRERPIRQEVPTQSPPLPATVTSSQQQPRSTIPVAASQLRPVIPVATPQPHSAIPAATPQPRPAITVATAPPQPLFKPPRPTHVLAPPTAPIDDGSSFYGDDADAYGGIEDPAEAQVPLSRADSQVGSQPMHEQYSSHSGPGNPNFDARQLHQTHTANAAFDSGEDAVARALHAVSVERARTQRAHTPTGSRHAVETVSGMASHPGSPPDRRAIQNPSPSRNGFVPPQGPVIHEQGSYMLPAGTRQQNPYTGMAAPRIQNDPSSVHMEFANGAWHRRAASHETYGSQQPQHRATDPGRQMASGFMNNDVPPMPGTNKHNSLPPSPNPMSGLQHPAAGSPPPQPNHMNVSFDPRRGPEQMMQQRINKTPAASVQQSFSSTNSRTGPPPRHLPSKLTMPQPLYNHNGPPPQNSTVPLSHDRFHPPPHNPGNNHPVPHRNIPAPPEPPRIQAQTIPIAVDSRKVLRKRSTITAGSPSRVIVPSGAAVPAMPDWIAPSSNPPPSRSKTQVQSSKRATPAPMPPVPAPAPQKGKKIPKRVLSKKRAEF